jgi:hypothetical protein
MMTSGILIPEKPEGENDGDNDDSKRLAVISIDRSLAVHLDLHNMNILGGLRG